MREKLWEVMTFILLIDGAHRRNSLPELKILELILMGEPGRIQNTVL